MRRMLAMALIVLVVLGAYVAVFLSVNHSVAADPADIVRKDAPDLPPANATIEIMTWNLGYGGLGVGSDFVADGGENYLPPSRAAVRENVAGIEAFLAAQNDIDVVLLEELAHGGPVNYWTNLKARVDRALEGRARLYYADFRTRLMPWPLRMNHGQGIYARSAIESTHLVPLPAEDEGIFGVRRRYGSLVARLPIEGREHGWTIASVHLAAFDDDAAVRTRQLRELLAWAQTEYESGQHVVLGGDWNLQIAETDFPHTTEERFLFWLFPFPQDALPEGWRIAADASIPSVRTNERAYRPGENYTTVIDGFIVSPNVSVDAVQGYDLGFAHSDHQPVRVRVTARD